MNGFVGRLSSKNKKLERTILSAYVPKFLMEKSDPVVGPAVRIGAKARKNGSSRWKMRRKAKRIEIDQAPDDTSGFRKVQ